MHASERRCPRAWGRLACRKEGRKRGAGVDWGGARGGAHRRPRPGLFFASLRRRVEAAGGRRAVECVCICMCAYRSRPNGRRLPAAAPRRARAALRGRGAAAWGRMGENPRATGLAHGGAPARRRQRPGRRGPAARGRAVHAGRHPARKNRRKWSGALRRQGVVHLQSKLTKMARCGATRLPWQPAATCVRPRS
ncbi:MAG: hypothetical protein J3K34DRAFT_418225 [Monoraphidium minutum]|nr:MAG: hypothetical protein J3K34DRAFT_418225 [Monoraphidium minutum]